MCRDGHHISATSVHCISDVPTMGQHGVVPGMRSTTRVKSATQLEPRVTSLEWSRKSAKENTLTSSRHLRDIFLVQLTRYEKYHGTTHGTFFEPARTRGNITSADGKRRFTVRVPSSWFASHLEHSLVLRIEELARAVMKSLNYEGMIAHIAPCHSLARKVMRRTECSLIRRLGARMTSRWLRAQ